MAGELSEGAPSDVLRDDRHPELERASLSFGHDKAKKPPPQKVGDGTPLGRD